MKRPLGLMLLALTLAACRDYGLRDRVSGDGGLVPPEQFARYGREQAQFVAAGRELARVGPDSIAQAAAYARTLPDVAQVVADPQGTWLTIQFKSGWRAATTPIDDGKRGAETAGLPAQR